MKRLVMTLILASAALVAAVAVAQDTTPAPAPVAQAPIPQAEIDKVNLLLSGYDYFPTRADLEAASGRAVEILVAISQDEAALPSARNRALDALGLFEGHPQVAAYFEQTLALGQLEPVHMRHVIGSCMKAFGQQALPWVTPFLDHQDLQTRLSAVHAVGQFGGVDGRETLRLRKPLERDLFVKEQIQLQLAR